MSKQLMLPANRAFNSNGIGVPFAVAKLYTTGTLTPQPFYSDSGLTTSLGSSITANGGGRFTTAYQDDDTAFRLIVVDATGAELDDIDPFYFGFVQGTKGDKGDAGSGGDSYATRSAIAALAPTNKDTAYLTETGRAGKFIFDSSDLSAKVAADTAQGIYIAPTAHSTGASGAWVRQFDSPVNLKWFGIVGGNASGANGSANYAAWLAMLATLRARIPSGLAPTFVYQPLEAIYAPMDYYEFSTTLDLTNGTGKLIGDHTGGQSTISTVFKFPAGQSGFRTQRYNSEGSGTTSSPTHLGGDSWLIEGIGLIGGFFDAGGSTEGEYHGYEVYSQITVKHFRISGFQGDGIFISSNTTTSLADSCHFEYGRVQQCRRGRYATGGDSNVCTFVGISYANNRTWGIEDNSFLGNCEIEPHLASNGWDGAASSVPTACSYSGNRYYLKIGQAAGASTNAPTGTTADNTWWGYQGPGGLFNGMPLWVSGTTFREGGSIKLNNANSRMVIVGCYTESDQNPAQGISPMLFLGGLGPSEQPGIPGLYGSVGGIGFGPGTGSKTGVFSHAGVCQTQLGAASTSANNAGRVLTTINTTYEPIGMGLMWGRGVGGTTDPSNLYWNQNNSNSVFRLLPFGTTAQLGTGTPQQYVFQAINFALGPTGTDSARKIDNGTAAPTSGTFAQGHIRFNIAAAASGKVGWYCTTGGWIATTAWASSHAYAVGALVTNDTGKSYLCTTAGTSASSGGPTGTGSGITDGTAVWSYSAGFTFKPFGAIDA